MDEIKQHFINRLSRINSDIKSLQEKISEEQERINDYQSQIDELNEAKNLIDKHNKSLKFNIDKDNPGRGNE